MNIFGLLKKNYFSLFVKREGKVVLGRSYSNLWLLVGVLTATFFAISFSNASLNYLRYKMDDPFINWVDMKSEFGQKQAFQRLETALADDELKEYYYIEKYQSDYLNGQPFCDNSGNNRRYFKLRFFDNFKSNDLVKAILEEDNVVNGWKINDLESLDDKSIGVIMTEDAMLQLGYKEVPSFIYFCMTSPTAIDYGFEVFGRDKDVVPTPIPVLGVVDRLPGNVDMIASSYLYQQFQNDYDYPFDMGKPEYGGTLNYYVPPALNREKFLEFVKTVIAKYPDSQYEVSDDLWNEKILPFTYYNNSDETNIFFTIAPEYEVYYDELKAINAEILSKYAKEDVHRVFDNTFSIYDSSHTAFLSVNFKKLDRIGEFEQMVRDEYKITIEMAQINAKENFNAVSTMANILSWAIIVFAIVCIILFIVNLLQSYFQKVKRNLGTFKAFGMGNYELISVYTLIMTVTILVATVVSLSAVWFSQGVLELINIMRDDMFGYLSLWSAKTISAMIIIILASVCTVYVVMSRLLRSTPGDLIYDR